ncbi:MAG: hypothetical protein OEM15_06655 [Myxococcales bacterium]|nr:hypothetical protein [Myxococcales bacterium]MDH3483368.1 hypothetical protein [Myxococcales bacterium]
MKERLVSSITALLVVCYGCADQNNVGLSSAAASAGNAVVSTARLDSLVEDPSDPDALISMTRIYSDLSAAANAGQDGAGVFIDFLTQKASLDECVTEDGSLITYDDCSVSNGTIDGTFSSSGDEIDFDLSISVFGTGGTGSLTVHMYRAIVLTRTSLAGSLTYDTTIEGVDQYPGGLSFTIHADYVDITFDDVQCPLSGALRVEQVIPGESTTALEAVFGPSCGDVRLSE